MKTHLAEDIQRWDVFAYDERQTVTEVDAPVDQSQGGSVHGLHETLKLHSSHLISISYNLP